MNSNQFSATLIERFSKLKPLLDPIYKAAGIIIDCYSSGGKVLLCGNGGSSSDADHTAGELMKSFEIKRPLDISLRQRLEDLAGSRGKSLGTKLEHALPAISLSSQHALNTAIANDIGFDMVFAQQIIGYGNPGDTLVAMSTSGNSPNVINACITAKALNMSVIGLTGEKGGKMKPFCDILINVPETGTAAVQELHRPVLHTLCRLTENHFYEK